MALEKWQKFLKASPCPLCGGYGSGKKVDNTRCKGYHHVSGKGLYCQNIKSSEVLDVHGLMLYWHDIKHEDYKQMLKDGLTTKTLPPPKIVDPNLPLVLEKEIKSGKFWSWPGTEIVEYTETWWVLTRDGQEVMRSLKKDVAERYLEMSNRNLK